MSKVFFFVLVVVCSIQNVNAQGVGSTDVINPELTNNQHVTIKANELSAFYVALDKTTHIISPEPILYVDISSSKVEGNLPEKNILRFKPDPTCKAGMQFQITVVTEQFVIVYKMTAGTNNPLETAVITINPNEALPMNAYNKVGKADFDRLSLLALSKKRKLKTIWNRKYGMILAVNNIYVIGDFLLFDISVKNKTRLQYNLEDMRFDLVDKNEAKAHVAQEVELKPVYQFYNNEGATITGKWRNFYLFRKFTYPGQKTFHIEITEKQISGRRVGVDVGYRNLLQAEYLL